MAAVDRLALSNTTQTEEKEFYEETGFVVGMIVLAVLGGYAITSYIFLKHPNWLHKKKKCKFTATHISHRGGKSFDMIC